jgi:hypothetical protein
VVLDQDRVRHVLRRSRITQVATLSPKNRPFMTPLWFAEHRGVLYITTGPGSRAGKNVATHPEITLLFQDVSDEASVLRVRGLASCRQGLPPWAALLGLARKYYLPPRAALVELRHARLWSVRRLYYAQAKGGVGHIRVEPTSADFLPRP